LISEHKCPNPLIEMIALPVAFDAPRAGVASVRCSRGLDRVGGGAEIMLGYVAYTSCLTGGVGGKPRGPLQGAGRNPSRDRRMPGRPSSSSPRELACNERAASIGGSEDVRANKLFTVGISRATRRFQPMIATDHNTTSTPLP
jgi:hypothetical protein